MPAAESSDLLTLEAHRLGDLVNGHPDHVAAVVPQLVDVLTATGDPRVVKAAVQALGHAWHPSAATALLDHVAHDHPDPQVRLALAQALPGCVEAPGDLHDRVVDVLTRMTHDREARVRDWAAFGLGQLHARSQPALDAAATLLSDPDRDTRSEALLTLAGAGDVRALPVLRRRLEADDELSRLDLEAAAALAAPALHAALRRLAQDWAGDQDEFTDLLTTALARCAPQAPATARHVEQDLLAQVRRLLPEPARVTLEGSYPRTVLTAAGGDLGEGLHLALWGDGERPEDGPTLDVTAAVRDSLARPPH
ncbi:HEAT repeat domain-containing protein [Kineococcus endophyticus]|uniref:HEAT repeat domain-containing protein n=1 Tax=Kineococcus endophyticus TaxID=1181883 RepID=A0ABV3PAX1_9ACTN